jgi:hypothetical protein
MLVFSPSAIEYARKIGIEVQPDQMAVIVQELVPADTAGVTFTADPNNGNPWHFVLSSTFGLAQDVMNGVAPADSFVFEWETSKIIEKKIVEKSTMLVPGKFGVEKTSLPYEKMKAASLSDSMAQRIAELALSLDRLFNLRVDIEWAVVGEDIYLVQVRPLTALPDFFPIELSEEDAELHWEYMENEFIFAPEWNVPYEPFFRGLWVPEMWTRYPFDGDVDFEGNKYRIIEFYGCGFQSHQKHASSLRGAPLEEFLDKNEPRFREIWLTLNRKMRETPRCVVEVKEGTIRASEIIPHLLEMRELYRDVVAAVLGLVERLHWRCQELLQNFVKDIEIFITYHASRFILHATIHTERLKMVNLHITLIDEIQKSGIFKCGNTLCVFTCG